MGVGFMSVLLEFSMYPLDKGESLSKYVARSLDIIDKSGVKYKMNPMSTVLEGEFDDVMNVVRKCYEQMRQDCSRIACRIDIDYRSCRENGLEGKIKSVEEKVGRELNK